jgi:MerR family transcriptional regulator, thiopeptide resistance regulator
VKAVTRRLFQASEFARIAGVTVRALHHYDRIGLLKPSGRTSAGYRLYGEQDFVRLQQIVTLKFIGFSLNQIKDLLNRNSMDLPKALRLQREILESKRSHLDRAVKAIEKAEQALAAGESIDGEAFAKICEVINMQNNMDWVKKYYTEEQLEELSSRWSPEIQEQAERDWAALQKDVQAAMDEGVDPTSERARELAARRSALIEQFTGGNPAILESLTRLYQDKANWPDTFEQPFSNESAAFISKAQDAHDKNES